MGKSKDCPAAQGGGAQGSAPAASAASEPGDPRPRRPQRHAASLGFSAPTREVRGTGRFPPDLLGLRLFRIAWSGGAGARNGHHLLTPEREEGPVGNAPGFGLQTAFTNTRAHPSSIGRSARQDLEGGAHLSSSQRCVSPPCKTIAVSPSVRGF